MPRHLSKAILLVDGYNMIGVWPLLRKKQEGHGMEEARHTLVETLINYSAFEGLDARVVFDAHYQNTPSAVEIVTRNVSVHYTDYGQTADTYIEKICASLAHQLRVSRRRLIVATSDRVHQLTVMGYGAEAMSALQLAHEVDSAARRRQRRHKPNKQSSGRFLANSLDAESQKRLAKLRMGLK
ncbi:MAG: NYN domain-containing protein [Cyanobacteriota bacterium]|nr:NYN domain-containing protein [Cyanobacteriota bacterium]